MVNGPSLMNNNFLLVSFQTNFVSNLIYLVSITTDSSFVRDIFIVSVKSLDKLLNYFAQIQKKFLKKGKSGLAQYIIR